MAATLHASSSAPWQQSRVGPLSVIVLLHAGLFFALQNGQHDSSPPTSPKELFATFITSERPTPATVSLPVPRRAQPSPRKAPKPPKAVQIPAAVAATAPQATDAPQRHVAAPDLPSPPESGVPVAAVAAAVAAQTAPTTPAQPKLLSSGVAYVQPPQPRYPPFSRRMGEEGRTILRVLVNPQGMPQRAEIRTSSGSTRLDEAAREAVMRAQFRPHIDNGLAVAVFVIVPIQFQLNH